MHAVARLLLSASLALPVTTLHAAAPPLADGEIVVQTSDGCGLVVSSRSADQYRVPQVIWGGACIDGLAMGPGTLMYDHDYADKRITLVPDRPMKGYAWYGRPLGPVSWTRAGGERMVSIATTNGKYWHSERPGEVTWGYIGKPGAQIVTPRHDLMTEARTCDLFPARFPECRNGSDDLVYYVVDPKRTPGPGETQPEFRGTVRFCPNPRSPVGCEAVWESLAEPARRDFEALLVREAAKNAPRVQEVERELACHRETGRACPTP